MNSTYLSSDRLPSLYFIYLYFQIPRHFFYNFSSSLPDTSPLLCGCCLSNLIVLIFIQVSFSSIAWHQEYSCSSSRIQLLRLKNTAASAQEYSCYSSRIQLLLLKNTAALLQEFHGSVTEVILTCFLVQCMVSGSGLSSYVLVCFVGSNIFPCGSVADPDPDPHDFGSPGSGSIGQRF